MIKLVTLLITVGNAKVINPACNVLAGLKELVAHADAPVSVGELPDSLLEFQQGLRVPFDSPVLECKAQELAFINTHHLTFVGVDHQQQAVFNKAGDAFQRSFPGTLAFDQNDEVIGIACKEMAALFQFFIQRIEHDVGQHRGQRSALGNTFFHLPEELVMG